MKEDYEIVVIGGGPAGLTAGLYSAMGRRATLLLEKNLMGGQIINADKIENFPGFPEGISGMDLAELMQKQTARFGLETVYAGVTGIEQANERYSVETGEGTVRATAIIVTAGSEHQKLGVPGEAEFLGKGVSYCATCDANFFRGKRVAVVGGGNAAVSEALYLTRFATRVFLIHRRGELRATRILQERAFASPILEPVMETVVEDVRGDGLVKELTLHNMKTARDRTLEIDGIFIAIGFKPNTAFVRDFLEVDGQGQIVTSIRLETSRRGVFAAGDIRSNSGRQAIIAAGDGATAALFAQDYLRNL